MDFKFPYKKDNPEVLIRRCGYARIHSRRTGQVSYTRKAGPTPYPRFHAYLKPFDNYFEISLHLDQKKPWIPGQKAHAAEYEGQVVEQEAQRITEVIKNIYED